MKNLFKPASLLFYFLVLLCFFIVGTTFAVLINAAKDQGLAGSAIVLGYGVMSGFFAVLASFVVVYFLPLKSIIKINRILAAVFLLMAVFLTIRYFTRNKSESTELNQNFESESIYYASNSKVADNFQQNSTETIGTGFFKPKFTKFSVLYVYGNPHIYKSQQNVPSDSVVFRKTEYGSYEIIYAPPWLQPGHLKLDYDMLFFKMLAVGSEYVEIVVNKTTRQSAYVKRNQGEVIFWPDFLLQVHSVEMMPEAPQKVRIKPLDYAAEINGNCELMKPLLVRNEWLFVELQDTNFKAVGNGWIKWKNENQLLISYSLLS